MTWPECPLWDFSITLYGRAGVEAACLDLQRRHGLDVNLLLFACWLASLGIELDQDSLARAQKAVSSWQVEVVRPLRASRRRLAARLGRAKLESLVGGFPGHVGKLQKAILALELDAEHLAQLALFDAAADLQPSRDRGPDLAACNLAGIRSFQADDRDHLRILLQQAFPAATEEQLAKALRTGLGITAA